MLPQLMFTAVDSMQEVASDDFDILNGVNSIYEKGMCLAVHRVTPNTSPLTSVDQQQTPSNENDGNGYIGSVATTSLVNGVKIENGNSTDLFPTHPTTWQQHPMNSREHAHHRFQNQPHSHEHRHHEQYQHRLNLITSKLLLQNSDDPLICRGANSVIAADDDHSLILAISQNADTNQNCQMPTMPTMQTNSSASASSIVNSKQPSAAASTQLPRKAPLNGCSSLTKQQLKVKAGLMSAQNRAAIELMKSAQQTPSAVDVSHQNYKTNASKLSKKKGVLKLRFHHQALPPEYLSHYEATQEKWYRRVQDEKPKAPEAHQKVKVFHPSKLPPPKSTHENVRSWLQKIAAIHRSAQQTSSKQRDKTIDQQQKKAKSSTIETRNDVNNNYQVSRAQASTPDAIKNEPATTLKRPYNCENSEPINSSSAKLMSNSLIQQPPSMTSVLANTTTTGTANLATLKRVVNYADLPYMGEITLDHSKPRRGRKPKKADICHLIYKNYGTIFPGTPRNVLTASHATTRIDAGPLKSNISNDLPLNLCMRDQQCDHLSISSEESEYVNGPSDSNIISLGPIQLETLLGPRLGHVKVESSEKKASSTCSTPSLSNTNSSKATELNANNVLLHPVSLYYQKLLSGTLVNQQSQPFGLPVETIEKDNQLTLKIPIPNGLLQTPLLGVDSPTIDYPDIMSTPSSLKSENSNMTTTTSVSSTVNTATTKPTHQLITPHKRKRSAIFIPPIPAENTTNPATEVSICKFKFTGGAKPSLQEKKMLSVDSGGNYRYYSGTGDKSTRGYEFFPRESLHNSAGFLPGVNCAATFQNAANECLMNDIPPPSAELSNEILQIPESPTGPLLLPGSVAVQVPSAPSPLPRSNSAFSGSPVLPIQQQILTSNCKIEPSARNASPTNIIAKYHFSNDAFETSNSCNSFERRKKPRRSSQREKLEKTFKEKGFLIQTQQLESAEGATYCKFRQLKKFTRYLFRNWKDYLPEEVHQISKAEGAVVTRQLNTERAVKKEADATDSFTDEIVVENLLERHGFLVTSGVCPQNSDHASTTSSLVEKMVTEHSVDDNAVKA